MARFIKQSPRNARFQSKSAAGGENDPAAGGSLRLDPRLTLGAILLFALALQLTTLFVPHNEGDEVIYLTLADKVSKNFTDYTLQGSPLLAKLPKATYDQPIFLRPPLFVYLLALFGIFNASLFLPVLASLATLWTTSDLAKNFTS